MMATQEPIGWSELHATTKNQMRAFLMVASTGNFSTAAAAVEMQMAQPSVSEIKRIEQAYGVLLFTRGPLRLVLTNAGKELLPHAQAAVDAANNADTALRSLTSLAGGVATFGLLRNASFYVLSRLLERFTTRFPDVRLRVIDLNSVEVAKAVTAGDLEAGLVVLPIDLDAL